MEKRRKIVTIKVIDLFINKISQPSTITGFIQICSAFTIFATHQLYIQLLASLISISAGVWDIWRKELLKDDLELAKELQDHLNENPL